MHELIKVNLDKRTEVKTQNELTISSTSIYRHGLLLLVEVIIKAATRWSATWRHHARVWWSISLAKVLHHWHSCAQWWRALIHVRWAHWRHIMRTARTHESWWWGPRKARRRGTWWTWRRSLRSCSSIARTWSSIKRASVSVYCVFS